MYCFLKERGKTYHQCRDSIAANAASLQEDISKADNFFIINKNKVLYRSLCDYSKKYCNAAFFA